MKLRILDLSRMTELSKGQNDRIMEDIRQTSLFGFSDDSDVNRNNSGLTGFHYLTGHADLFQQYGQYMDKIPSTIVAAVKGSPEDEICEEAIAWGDDAIENIMAEQLTTLITILKEVNHDKCIIALNKKQTSPIIPKDIAKTLFYMLDDADFQNKTSPYIIREAYKQMYSCSIFAPYAHCLIALKLRTKRTDAKNELHSAYFWGNLSFLGKETESLDFSQFFTVIDYWYYEMETGVNLCMEITAVLIELSKKKAITSEDIPCICDAISECFNQIAHYPILTRIYLLRTCIQYSTAYMQEVRKNPASHIVHLDYLKSPINDKEGCTFECPIELISPKDRIDIKFTGKQLSWVFSEILPIIEIPFRSYLKTDVTADSISECAEIPPKYLVAESKQPNCALAFCDLSHPHINDCIDYIRGPQYGKNKAIERIFKKVHTALFEGKKIQRSYAV